MVNPIDIAAVGSLLVLFVAAAVMVTRAQENGDGNKVRSKPQNAPASYDKEAMDNAILAVQTFAVAAQLDMEAGGEEAALLYDGLLYALEILREKEAAQR